MKLNQYALLFLSIFLVFFELLDARIQILKAAVNETLQMDEAIGRAVDEALENLVVYDGGNELEFNKEKAVELLFISMESSLGILDDQAAKERLRHYFPVMAVLDYNGFYIRYAKEYTGTEESVMEYVWTEKQYYVWEDDLIACRFEKEDTILLLDKTGILTGTEGRVIRIARQELLKEQYRTFQQKYPGHFLLSEEAFAQRKRDTITRLIENSLQYYCKNHNKIAEKIGIPYEFAFPDMDASQKNRAIPDVGMLISFQGYPLKAAGILYDRFLMSGAYLKKETKGRRK